MQCRRSDARAVKLLSALDDEASAGCVAAERKLVRALEGDCHSPIAALATITAGVMTLRAAIGARDGKPPVIHAVGRATREDAESAVAEVFQSLLQQGVAALLAGDA